MCLLCMLAWIHFQAMLPGSAPVFKEGFIMKKNIMEAPHKKGQDSCLFDLNFVHQCVTQSVKASISIWSKHVLYTCTM